MRTLMQAREKLISDVSTNLCLLAQVEAVLCEDQTTVMLYVPNGSGSWHAAYFELSDGRQFDAGAIESAARFGLH